MTMRERIARGQAEFDGRGWLNMHSADRKRYLQRADLFLAAIREPTEAMVKAGVAHSYDIGIDLEPGGVAWFHEVLIDAAISEGKT